MNKGGFIRERVAEAAHSIQSTISELTSDDAKTLRREIAETFEPGNWDEHQKANWEHFFENNAVESERLIDYEAWQWISTYLKKKPTLLLFERGPTYEIGDGAAITAILRTISRNAFMPNFYATDRTFEYLLGYEDSERLYGVGSAENWLKELQLGAIYQLLDIQSGILDVSDVHFNWMNGEIIFACQYDSGVERKPFQMKFTPAISIDWIRRHSKGDFARIGIVHLYEQGSQKWVVIRTGKFRVKMQYKEFSIEKDW